MEIATKANVVARVDGLEDLVRSGVLAAEAFWNAAGAPDTGRAINHTATAADHYYTLSQLLDAADTHVSALDNRGGGFRASAHRNTAVAARDAVNTLYRIAMACDYGVLVPTEYVPNHQVQQWMLQLEEAATRAEVVCRRECILFIAAEIALVR